MYTEIAYVPCCPAGQPEISAVPFAFFFLFTVTVTLVSFIFNINFTKSS